MRGTLLVDLRNVYDRAEAEAAGLVHYGLGRGRRPGKREPSSGEAPRRAAG